jgi:hypothetical protein
MQFFFKLETYSIILILIINHGYYVMNLCRIIVYSKLSLGIFYLLRNIYIFVIAIVRVQLSESFWGFVFFDVIDLTLLSINSLWDLDISRQLLLSLRRTVILYELTNVGNVKLRSLTLESLNAGLKIIRRWSRALKRDI